MILFLFFCSGATALIYEVVWSKYLALMFGSTIQAQTVVLAVFMGGLALGNWLIGRRADFLRRPLAVYGYLEVAIGLYAFFFDFFYDHADKVFVELGSGHLDQTLLLLGLKGALSFCTLILPTIFMGGTLPLLAAWLQKETSDAGRRSARFYSVNSLGAVAGAGLAGFFLVNQLGMVSTLQATALANIAVGGVAMLISRRTQWQGDLRPAVRTDNVDSIDGEPRSSLAWGCALVAITGGISMGLEVLATRSLSMIFGASLQSFAVMLMAFILGIGVGSAVMASPRLNRLQNPNTTTTLLLATAFSVAVYIISLEKWAIIYAKARTGLASTEMGFFFHELLTCLIAVIVLGIPAALLGSVLPLWIRIISGSTSTLGHRVGRLLTWNTIGAVAGVLLTGFLFMPMFGVRGALGTFAVLLSLVGGVTAWLNRQQRPVTFSVALAGVLIWICLSRGNEWRDVLASGVFRLRTADVPWNLLDTRRKFVDLIFYEDGPDATVSVETGSKLNSSKETVLRVNGKPDASTEGDLSTQLLLANLPMMARPQAKDVFVLGFGSGITAGALLNHPIDHLTIAENCRPVLHASKIFEPWNHGVLTNARTRVFYEDGRTVLKLSQQRYDIIVSEPSNPWVAGIGSVFSMEFYQYASQRLKDGGIMAQWFHLYEMHDGIAFLVLRTFASVFPYVEIWDSQEGDLILLGSKSPWKSTPEVYREVFDREAPRQDLARIGLKTPEAVLTRQIASQRTAFAIAGDGPIQSDSFPVLEYAAPKAFYIAAFAQQLFLFDERTWQTTLAPPEKNAVLRSISKEDLDSVFARYTFSNRELLQYLNWRRANLQSDGKHGVYPINPYFSVVFRPPESYPAVADIPPKSGPETIQMLQAQSMIFSQASRWQEGVRIIETVLQSRVAAKDQTTALDWLPGHFASLAARTYLIRGDAKSARRLLGLGLKIVPGDAQLLYLQRIVDRQQKANG